MPRKSRRASRRFDAGSGRPVEPDQPVFAPAPDDRSRRRRREAEPEPTDPELFEDDRPWQPAVSTSEAGTDENADEGDLGQGETDVAALDPVEVEAPLPPTDFVVTEEQAGERLDTLLAARYVRHSRTRLRLAIVAGTVTVDGERAKVAYRVVPGERIVVELPAIPATGPLPEPIPLSILYEDDHLIVIDKPPGMVVHPARGHWAGTLAGAVAYHVRTLSTVGGAVRPGIVHRLDRDTSGVIVIAKTDAAHLSLASQFEHRTVEKEYWAIVSPPPGHDRDWIDLPIGPHARVRERMAVRPDHPAARAARTFFEVVARRAGVGLVKAFPTMGRTHQIRVHFANRGFPILADALYGGRKLVTADDLWRLAGGGRPGGPPEPARLPVDPERTEMPGTGEDTASRSAIVLDRQALHARRLAFDHPVDGRRVTVIAPLPADMGVCLSIVGLTAPTE